MSDAADPFVSVIVPVRDRRDLLLETLDGLARQSYGRFEVVIVDDGSTDGSPEVAEQFGTVGSRLRVVRRHGGGAVAARRAGTEVACGDVFAFLDSDCVPDPDWLRHGAAAIASGNDLVQGRTEPAGPVRPLERSIWTLHDDGLYPTCNVFYRRSAFEAAGGFDGAAGERLGFRPGSRLRDLGFGEDTLLGWAVRRAGRAAFCHEAVVHHHVFDPDLGESFRRAWNTGAFPALVAEVPELRDTLLRGRVVLGSVSRLPLYGAAATGLAGRRRAALAGVVGWVLYHVVDLRRREPSRRRLVRVLPVALALDAVAAAALVAGSARARQVVL